MLTLREPAPSPPPYRPLRPHAGWHLAWVMVTNTATGATAFFPCNQWLAKNEGDRKIERILDAETQSAPMPAPTGTAVVSVLPQQPAVAVPAAPPGIPTEAYLDPGHLLRKLGAGGVGQPGYKLIFHTSNVVMAGTNAPVFFELVGENGSSGEWVGELVSVCVCWSQRGFFFVQGG